MRVMRKALLADFGAVTLCLLPSLGFFPKLFGVSAAVAMLPAALVLAPLALRLARDAYYPDNAVRSQHPRIIALLLVALFAVLFPLAKSGWLGPGSDRDNALNVALHALLHGQYPYSARTFLGNPPTPMPGALLLALPAYLAATSALQNLVWGPGFVLFGSRLFDTATGSVLYPIVFIILCLASLDDFVVGGDYLVNCLYVIVAVHLVLTAFEKNWSLLKRFLAVAFFALAISSRPIFVMSVPVVAAFLQQRRSSRATVEFIAAASILCAAINLPFYLHDPSNFPIATLAGKLDDLPGALHAPIVIPAISFAVASASLLVRMSRPRVYAMIAASFVPMFYPLYAYQLWSRGLSTSLLLDFGYSLPVSMFAGIWLFSTGESDRESEPIGCLS